MKDLKDIELYDDIVLLVNSFYSKVQVDDLIGPIFNSRIGNNWTIHLEKMYKFWQTVLLEEHTYSGRPFPPHKDLPIHKEHFDRWLEIFHSTLNENFAGKNTEEAKSRAGLMAQLFLSKLNYINTHPGKSIL
ncbi:MAG: group III truncated hemoglobin [Bacteroidota bacterium]|nr:group III truncated hemoglobin [Bacteroidota bacterium]